MSSWSRSRSIAAAMRRDPRDNVMAVPPGPGAPHDTAAPTCFRHPGRETYVSCVRCGRPACPDCLRSAAVGQQCVECIREGNRGTRRAAAPFGGRVTTGTPLVTWTLVALNVLVYLVEIANQNLVISNGALVGRFGAWFVVAKRLRRDSRQVVILIVLNLAITFVFRSSIAWQDHLGGLIAGGALAAAYAYAPRANRTLVQVAATVALLALLVVGVVVRDQQLTHAAIAGFR